MIRLIPIFLLLTGCELVNPAYERNEIGQHECSMELPDGTSFSCVVDMSEGRVYEAGKVVVEEEVIEIVPESSVE